MSQETERAMLSAIEQHLVDETGCHVIQFNGIKVQILADIAITRHDGTEDRLKGRGIRYVSTTNPITHRALDYNERGDYILRSHNVGN